MSYLLNATTLKNPYRMEVKEEEVAKSHETLNGEIKKDIVGQKKIYTLYFSNLTQTELNAIMAIYNGKVAASFSVSSGDLTIPATDVWVSIQSKQYNTRGSEYRADLVLVLEEVNAT